MKKKAVFTAMVICAGALLLTSCKVDEGTDGGGDSTVTVSAISGVTPPATGEIPDITIDDNDEYTGTVSWDPVAATFQAITSYTATITLVAKTGYTLDGVSADFFTVAGATATNAAGSGLITAVFPETGDATVSTAAISGVTPPVTGEIPDITIDDNNEYTGTVSWDPVAATFQAITSYTATITLTAKSGYTLDGVSADFFTVDGATATNAAGSGLITAVFPETVALVVRSISAGGAHTMAVRTDGSLWATGRNNYGQLGDESNTHQNSFVAVENMMTGVKSVSAGDSHTMVVKTDGSLWATGRNNYGQLGDGSNTHQNSFVAVENMMTDVESVSAGTHHTMIVKTDGSLWATGRNYYGQHGSGNTSDSNKPVKIESMTNVQSVSAGDGHTMVVKTDGSLWAAGRNEDDQLGDGSTTNQTSFVEIIGMTGVKSVSAAGGYTMALKTDGTLWATGSNAQGQLGNASTTNQTSFVEITGMTSVESVSAAGGYTMALKIDGSLWATGSNGKGQFGNASTTNETSFVEIVTITGVESVSTGSLYTMILKTDGTLWATGYNRYGQLGNGTNIDVNEPIEILWD